MKLAKRVIDKLEEVNLEVNAISLKMFKLWSKKNGYELKFGKSGSDDIVQAMEKGTSTIKGTMNLTQRSVDVPEADIRDFGIQ